MERSVAGQLGRLWTSLAVSSLTRLFAGTNQTQRLHKFVTPLNWRMLLLLVAAFSVVGCGSEKSAKPTLTPRELKTDAERLSLVQFSPDGKQLAAGGTNGEAFVWKDGSDRPLTLESRRTSPLVSLTWSPDGLLCVTDVERGLVGWQVAKAEPDRVEFPPMATTAVCVAFRPQVTDRELVLGMRDGSLLFLDKSGAKQIKPEHRGPVKQILYSLDGKWLVSAGADGQLLWRDAVTRQVKQKVAGAETDIGGLLLSSDGQQLISGDWNGRLKVWNMETRKMLREFEQPEAVSGLGWVRGELVSGSWDGTLRGWDITSGRCVRSVVTGQPIHDLTTDSPTSRVATASLDQSIRIWDWQSAPSP